MNEEKDMNAYDENESIKFIRENLPEDMRNELSDDEITYVVDLMYEYYEEQGFLDEDQEGEIEIDEDELLDFVISNAKKDKIKDFSDEQIEYIVAGELAYFDSLDYEEE